MNTNLNFPADTWDRNAHFAFEWTDRRGDAVRNAGYLCNDTSEGVIYLMRAASCIKDEYTDADRAYGNRIDRGEQVVRNGDVVTVDGKQYTVKILGNYADAGRLMPV